MPAAQFSDARRRWRVLTALVALLVVAPAMTPLAAAAGPSSVSLTPADTSVDAGETTTFQVVVDTAQGGVGAAEFGVAVDDSVAEITDVEVFGSGATNTELAADGSSVDVEYAFRDTADTGSVAIAEVTVQGLSEGSTAVQLEAAAGNDGVLIFDEGGTGYDVTDTNDATLSVGDEPSPEPATFAVSNLQAPAGATQGDEIDVSAAVENTGGQAATKTVDFRVDTDGDGSIADESAVASQDVALDAGASTTIEFTDIDTSELSVGTVTHGVATADDSATAQLTVEAPPEPASFQVSNLSPTDVTVTQGDVIDVSATVENTGEQSATKAVEFRIDGDTLATQDVTLSPGESTTVTFDDIDTSGLEAGEYTHGVFTENDSATATVTVAEAGLPPVGDFDEAPNDLDGDGTYEDVNGDGTFDVVDVQALFANRDDATVQNNPAAFDFNGDGTFDVVDVQALFDALEEEN